MNPNSKIPFAESKQDRSQKTLEDILQAAEQIVDEADPDLFTSRTLAQRSGYALGTLVRRLSSIENVFLWAIKTTRDKKFAELSVSVTQSVLSGRDDVSAMPISWRARELAHLLGRSGLHRRL